MSELQQKYDNKTQKNWGKLYSPTCHTHSQSLSHMPFTCLAEYIDSESHIEFYVCCKINFYLCGLWCVDTGFVKKTKTFLTFIVHQSVDLWTAFNGVAVQSTATKQIVYYFVRKRFFLFECKKKLFQICGQITIPLPPFLF